MVPDKPGIWVALDRMGSPEVTILVEGTAPDNLEEVYRNTHGWDSAPLADWTQLDWKRNWVFVMDIETAKAKVDQWDYDERKEKEAT